MRSDSIEPASVPGVKPLGATELKRLHRRWRKRTDHEVALILDGVQQPYNVGGLIRSAAAYGVGTIWTVPPTADPSHPKVQVTAKQCDRYLEIIPMPTGVAAVAGARARGYRVVAVELIAGAVPLFDLDLSGSAVALVLGHEDRGVHPETVGAADEAGFLPLVGRVGSLNVAHTGTAALAEVRRQHWSASGAGHTSSSR